MEVFKMLFDQLLTNPMFQGAVVSLVVANLKNFFKSLDVSEKDPDKVKNVQMLVVFLSAVVAVLDAYVKGSMGQISADSIKGFVEILLGALGTHQLGKSVKKVAGSGK